MKLMLVSFALLGLAGCQTISSEANAIRPDIRTLEAFTSCTTHDCILPIVEATGRCFIVKEDRSWGTYYRHEDCREDSAEKDDIVLGFGDGGTELSASITTQDANYADQLFKQAEALDYIEATGEIESNDTSTRRWFDTVSRPDSRLMWETFEKEEGSTRWHIGIVWEGQT